ncbi:MAG: hypothetical protein ACLFUZ_04755 [Candidatus Micrarchaeia archaeon]
MGNKDEWRKYAERWKDFGIISRPSAEDREMIGEYFGVVSVHYSRDYMDGGEFAYNYPIITLAKRKS